MGAEQLFGDDEGTEGVACGGTSIADYMRVAEGNAVGRGRVDSSVHAGYWELKLEDLVGGGGVGGFDLQTAYFFAGGRARWPWSKVEA